MAPNRKLAILAVALMTAANAPPVEGETHTMEIKRKADLETIDGPEEFFTGKATITGGFNREEPSRLTGAIVHFEPGARTAWHSHPLGQTLIVTEGVGWTQIEGGPKYEFHEGDIMLCPADKKHWHGATPHEAMTHIAIQEALDGKNVTWMEKVTDEEYHSDLAED
jgi:quercetin dioxygenase-like cupin family protein